MRDVRVRLVAAIILLALATPLNASPPDYSHAPKLGKDDWLQRATTDWPYEFRSKSHGGTVWLDSLSVSMENRRTSEVLSTTADTATTQAALNWLTSCKVKSALHGKAFKIDISFLH
jgi:hypothetical protein